MGELVKSGKPYVKESQVGDGSANGRKDTSIRSSQVHFLTYQQEQHWATKSVKRKVYATTKLPFEHMEALHTDIRKTMTGEAVWSRTGVKPGYFSSVGLVTPALTACESTQTDKVEPPPAIAPGRIRRPTPFGTNSVSSSKRGCR